MDANKLKTACTETLVIGLLRGGPMHGYQMCREIEERTDGFFALKHSTLYPILHRLEKQGIVRGEWGELDSGKPRKLYRLTERGAAYYQRSAAEWRSLFGKLALVVPEVAT
jgi:PadR family transcriptional regulator PadR